MSRLGELLVRENLISITQLQKALEAQRKSGGRLGQNLTKLGIISEAELTNFLAKQYGVPSINLSEFEIAPEVIALVPPELAKRHQLIPVNRTGQTLIVVMADPSNIYAIDDLKFRTGLNIEVVVASEQAIEEAIQRYYDKPAGIIDQSLEGLVDEIDYETGGEEEVSSGIDITKQASEAPVVKLCNAILLNAIKKNASDIHIEPYEKSYRVRYRIDGMLYEEQPPLPLRLKNAITSRFKIMSNLDISERRLPQDGRIKLRIGKDKEMDFRVSVLPTLFGEKIVLRLLDKSNLQLDMTKLGFDPEPLEAFKESINKPYGMVLVTGPTGSGKTTTLYSALSELNKTTRNISTAEDPVEYNLVGINQVQVNDAVGLNFAAALRAFLRQDPNIIMVGEIRDFETAEIAVKAALTGHLVLSTLHTNDAPSTVSRLLNMGIEPFLVTASVNLILAQRLARKICQDCKQPAEKNVAQLIKMGMKPEVAESIVQYRGVGCRTCNGTGYKGRIALYEVMPFYESLKELVLQGASAAEIKAEAIRNGLQTLRMSGLKKIAEGITTPEEVMRVTVGD
ncbi:MAG: type IV-A pilus assembly ATPase PilB [Myxococcales bacterium]|nr:type IV-A pilus assembly ATPase PilB [Myxococcota bacterium]MDW8281342.1 type IV-A pilus assembly ATPase PilB [Myxococcales bacterium]